MQTRSGATLKALRFTRQFSSNFRIRFNKADEEGKGSLSDALFSEEELVRKYKFNYLHDLPYDLDGTHKVPKLAGRKNCELFLEAKQIDEEFLTDKFHNMVQDFYSSIANKDYDTLYNLTEKRFADTIKEANKQNETNKISLKFKTPDTPHAERAPADQSYIFDKMFEKGVYFDREKNDSNYDYFLDNELEFEGIRYYQHKYFAGYSNYYYLDRYVDQVGGDDKLARYRYKYIADQRNRSIVFRIYGVMRNIGRFTSSASKSLYSETYTGNHLVIFENQLQEPPIISLANPNVGEWIKRHRINHSNWRISDVDNYMKGKEHCSFGLRYV